MNYRIVTDSSSNLLEKDRPNLGVVPLHILVGDQEFIDDETLELAHFQEELCAYKGKSSTSCPSPQEWEAAFADADVVFCVTITSGLSGSYRSAVAAKDMYESEHPGRIVYVIDSLSTGPELVLLVDKLYQLFDANLPHEQIYQELCGYLDKTHLCFSLASVDNFAKNGRISPIIAKGVGILGIKIVGQASDEGPLQVLEKCRGDKKAFPYLVNYLQKKGYAGGRLIIAHNNNPGGADELMQLFHEAFGSFEGSIHGTRGLCSYYAEPQSILIGFESV